MLVIVFILYPHIPSIFDLKHKKTIIIFTVYVYISIIRKSILSLRAVLSVKARLQVQSRNNLNTKALLSI